MLANKKILFIGPRFFGYEEEIRKNLINLGATVDFYDDRPSNDFFTKLFIRINFHYLVQRKIQQYYQLMLENINFIQSLTIGSIGLGVLKIMLSFIALM